MNITAWKENRAGRLYLLVGLGVVSTGLAWGVAAICDGHFSTALVLTALLGFGLGAALAWIAFKPQLMGVLLLAVPALYLAYMGRLGPNPLLFPLALFLMLQSGYEWRQQWKHLGRKKILQKLGMYVGGTLLTVYLVFPLFFSFFLKQETREAVPPIAFYSLEGEPASNQDFTGKVVVMDFWGTWCGPCLASFPQLEALYQSYKDHEEVEFLVVNTLSNGDTPEGVAAFAEQKGYSLPFYLDRQNSAYALGVTSLPTTLLIDKQGQIRIRHEGFYPGENFVKTMGEELDKLLKEPE